MFKNTVLYISDKLEVSTETSKVSNFDKFTESVLDILAYKYTGYPKFSQCVKLHGGFALDSETKTAAEEIVYHLVTNGIFYTHDVSIISDAIASFIDKHKSDMSCTEIFTCLEDICLVLAEADTKFFCILQKKLEDKVTKSLTKESLTSDSVVAKFLLIRSKTDVVVKYNTKLDLGIVD